MFIRAYLRASTQEQNAERARESLVQFAANHGQRIAAFYVENVSGATLHRPELMKLIADSGEGDIVLVEQIDRLARLKQSDWDSLKQKLATKRLAIVSPELPTSWLALEKKDDTGFTDSILRAVNAMMLDMLAAVARKDYEDRRRRQFQGIHKAKTEGKYQGRQPDLKRRQHIASLLKSGHSYSEIQEMLSCSRHLIASVAKEQRQADAAARNQQRALKGPSTIGDLNMLSLSATLIAFLSFVAVVLFICVIAYRSADRLEAFVERKFRKKVPRQNGDLK